MTKIRKNQKPLPWASKSKKKPFERQRWNQEFYNSQSWRRCGTAYRRKNPLCEVSRCQPADVTDHAIPVNQGGHPYDERNFIALAHDVHNKKSGMEAHTPILIDYFEEDGFKIPVNKYDLIKVLGYEKEANKDPDT